MLAYSIIQIGSFSVTVGMLIAAGCSWLRNKSVIWAIIQGLLLSWVYVIYWALTGGSAKSE
jgi:hypothetical protein